MNKTVNGATIKYFRDGANVIAEYDGNNTLTATYLEGLGIDERISETIGQNTYYYLGDHLGSVRQVVDSSEVIQNSYEYSSFREVVGTLTENVSNAYRFTGRRWDSESCSQYHRWRTYFPDLGRWNAKDPAGDGPNAFLYVMNDPVNLFDLFGQEEQKPGKPSFGKPGDPPFYSPDPPGGLVISKEQCKKKGGAIVGTGVVSDKRIRCFSTIGGFFFTGKILKFEPLQGTEDAWSGAGWVTCECGRRKRRYCPCVKCNSKGKGIVLGLVKVGEEYDNKRTIRILVTDFPLALAECAKACPSTASYGDPQPQYPPATPIPWRPKPPKKRRR